VDVGDVHITYGAVVEKMSTVPAAALVTVAKVTVTVVDPAIETDTRAPVAFMEDKSVTAPAPIGGGPKETRLRRRYPRAWYPVVIGVIVVVGPVAGRPDIALVGARGLLLNRKGWGPDPDRYAHLGKRRGGHHQD
jgi:hypothetical protein